MFLIKFSNFCILLMTKHFTAIFPGLGKILSGQGVLEGEGLIWQHLGLNGKQRGLKH